ncbi:MAG: NAD(P)/FAD-dependent oxidoreductase [Patescibacteria group bacterium]
MKETMENADKIWDVVVIGGGPAGMMAAGRASELGAEVLLLEKNDSLGKKLLITGGGRCNLTNAEPDVRKFLSKFKDSDKFLFSPFSQFGVQESLDFFHSRGMETKVEALGRVFPASNSAQSVWNTLLEYLKANNVSIRSNCPVTGFEKSENKITAVVLKNAKKIESKIYARKFILATGGKSRPETGSTGDGFEWLKTIGHTVVEPSVALVPVTTSDAWVKRLQGVSMSEVKITLLQNEIKQDAKVGKILFTHFGVSGPTILNMSRDIGELLKYGEVVISLDLLPHLDHGQLNTELQKIFAENDKKKIKNVLDVLVPSAVAPIILELAEINSDTACNSVTRENRMTLIKILKGMQIHPTGLLGEDKAVITSGGISLDEVDFKTMSSKLFPNLYVVGDILNIDRPTGGYGLQLCWTSGYVAGTNTSA